MSTLGVNAAVLAALAAVIGIILYAVLASGWRIIHDDGRRLAEMLRRRGSAPDQAFDVAGYQAAIAVRLA